MKTALSALARFCLEQLARQVSREDRSLGADLVNALGMSDDRRASEAITQVLMPEMFSLTPSIRDEGLVPRLVLAAEVLGKPQVPVNRLTVLARTGLGLLRDAEPRGERRDRLSSAWHAADVEQWGSVDGHLGTREIREVGGQIGEVIEGMRQIARMAEASQGPDAADLNRGRKSRADMVMALLRAREVTLKDVERGRVRILTRDVLVEAILRDAFWDDIDASVQEDGVVAKLLKGGPSPAIDLREQGYPQVYIKRIVL